MFDTSSFIVLGHYYPERFPTFWSRFDELVANQEVTSVREVRNELKGSSIQDWFREWLKKHGDLFGVPSEEETRFVAEIFKVAHFQALVGEKQRLQGRPVADPFVVARAKVLDGTVVTMEKLKPNAAKIPNVCKHFDNIPCMNVDEFLGAKGWIF